MPLPLRSKNPPESLPYATCVLITFNVLFYALTTNGLLIHRDDLAKYSLSGDHFDLPHMLSSMFLHGSILHIFGNMWFLYLFGFAVEGRLRSIKFLVLYFAAGFSGDLLDYFLSQRDPTIPSLGASGAIMGVVAAGLWLFPFAKITVLWGFGYRWSTYDWPLWTVALYFLGFDVLYAVLGARDGVGHLAHIGGAVGGLLVCILFRPHRDSAEASEAKAYLHEAKDLSVLSRSELGEMQKSNPDDPLLTLHWMDKSLQEGQPPSAPCRDAFARLLPRMLEEIDVRPVSSAVAANYAMGGETSTRLLLDLARRLELAGEPTTALRFYEMAAMHPKAQPADIEASTFRIGLLCQSSLNDPGRAARCYEEILTHWPMGHFADQAKLRLAALGKAP